MSQSTEVQRFPLPLELLDVALHPDPTSPLPLAEGLAAVIDDSGDPWFIARHVCAVLGIANSRDAVSRLDTDEYKQLSLPVGTTDTYNKQRVFNLVNEAGLYSLILTSRRPQARAFKRWVTHDVLPAIRKTGAYAEPVRPKTRVELARELLAAEERAEELEKALDGARNMLTEAGPKVEAFDKLMDTDGSVSLATAAQLVGIGRSTLIERLARWGAIISRPGHSDHLRPYQSHVKAGRFVIVAQAVDITHRDGTSETLVKGTTRVTAKGVEWIRLQIKTGGPRVEMIAR